jgi:Ca2+-binding RTX toxin-like protein
MSRISFHQWAKKLTRTPRTTQRKSKPRRMLAFEQLDARLVFSVSASFSGATGVLSVIGDSLNNNIVVSHNAAGALLVNGGAVTIVGGTATVANTSLIQVFGQAGNDQISLDETNGTLPSANLFGGDGNDILTGGSAKDLIFGQAGDDTLLGKGGDDQLFGGDGNDTLTGGIGNDSVFGENGNDRMIWNPGEGTDLNEGGAGIDTVEVNGGNGSEIFTVTANGSRVRFDRVSPGPFSLDIGTSEHLVLNANGGDDTFTAGNGLAPLISLTVDGGAGNDTITGGDGNDLLIGGDGNDTINGGRGNDIVHMGAGDDTFIWNPGDGSDTVEGETGADTLQFNGANLNEKIDLSANGTRLRLVRDIGGVTMDVNGVEQVNVAALGGADTLTVNDLSRTSVTGIAFDLAGTLGGETGDGQADSVIVNGTERSDAIRITGTGTSYKVAGLSATILVQGSGGADDQLFVNALGGNDSINAAGLAATVTKLTVDGGSGSDTIIGSDGNDSLFGGDGNDTITGGRGSDTAFLGTGNDTFIWNNGDGSDIVEGQTGNDTLQFNGANLDERIDLSANGNRLRMVRDLGTVTMDVSGVEQVNVATLGGQDTVTVNNLAGTGVMDVNIDLAGALGSNTGDRQGDTVIVNGTAAADTVTVSGSGSSAFVTGLSARVNITHSDGTGDNLHVNTLAGNDTINAARLNAGVISLTIDSGDGDDLSTGSAGNDTIVGGRGNDRAFMGAGKDTFVWNPGDGSDTVDGQSGADTLQFNGANLDEKIDLSANGSRLHMTRDVGGVTMDVDGVEQVNIDALGGADTLTVNDLSQTDVTNVNIDLGATPDGRGDGQADTVIINGTAGHDAIQVASDATGISATGLAAQVNISGADPATDHLKINALGGHDTITAAALGAGAIQFSADGGDGNDVLIGSPGIDTLTGGAGDDVLFGGAGQDILDGGPGNNTVAQD